MDVTYITPFIKAVENVLGTMLQVRVTFGKPAIKPADQTWEQVTGTIGLTGDVQGLIAVTFPQATAERLASGLIGESVAMEHPDFADAIGEIVNMICGNAKANFVNLHASITCPQVVLGECNSRVQNNHTPTILLPAETDCGNFRIEITLRATQAQVASDAA